MTTGINVQNVQNFLTHKEIIGDCEKSSNSFSPVVVVLILSLAKFVEFHQFNLYLFNIFLGLNIIEVSD